MMLQACLNGARPAGTPLLPLTPDQLAADALACRDAGAGCLHMHPRGADGAESLAPEDCAAALRAVRAAVPGTPVGLSTGDWIAPRSQRLSQLAGWTELPDFVSLNLSEPDAPEVLAMMRARGIGIELGLESPGDLDRLLALPDPAAGAVRVMIEMNSTRLTPQRATAETMLARVRQAMPEVPVLLHGFDATAWDFIGLARDWDCPATRVGMEDVLTLPGGAPAGNPELVAAAAAMLAPFPAFPRERDDHPPAWGLTGDRPREVWERHSTLYEAQAARLTRAFVSRGYRVEFSGAGSRDGEFIAYARPDGSYLGLTHLEDPSEAKALARMNDDQLSRWIEWVLAGQPEEGAP